MNLSKVFSIVPYCLALRCIYVYGDGDTQLTVLADLDSNNPLSSLEVNQVLTDQKLSTLSQKSYQEYYAFSVDYKNRVVYGVDLLTNFLLDNPQLKYSQLFSTSLISFLDSP